MSDEQGEARLWQDSTSPNTSNNHLQYTPELPEAAQTFLKCLFDDMVEAIGEALAMSGSRSCCEGGEEE